MIKNNKQKRKSYFVSFCRYDVLNVYNEYLYLYMYTSIPRHLEFLWTKVYILKYKYICEMIDTKKLKIRMKCHPSTFHDAIE